MEEYSNLTVSYIVRWEPVGGEEYLLMLGGIVVVRGALAR